jgi:hypothetical protein
MVNGNDRNKIWDAMLDEMVRRFPQVAAGLPPPPNAPTNNDVAIAPPARGTNDDISFIMDHLNADEEDVDEEAEEVTTPLIDQCRNELEAYKRLPKLTMMGNCPLEWWKERIHKFPILSKLA